MSRRKERHSYDPGKSPPITARVERAAPPTALAEQASACSPGSSLVLLDSLLCSLVARDDGWLRVAPDPLDDKLYFKWKFTRGRWAGHYVMSVVRISEVTIGLRLLDIKLTKVESGTFRPSLDTYHDTR